MIQARNTSFAGLELVYTRVLALPVRTRLT